MAEGKSVVASDPHLSEITSSISTLVCTSQEPNPGERNCIWYYKTNLFVNIKLLFYNESRRSVIIKTGFAICVIVFIVATGVLGFKGIVYQVQILFLKNEFK